MNTSALRYFLSPRSIAVIGASQNSGSISGKPLAFLARHGYGGELYPVNPRYQEIAGLRCYPDLASIGKPVDLVIVVVAARHVLDVLKQCAQCKAGFVNIVSSGFAESGEEGRLLQQRIKALCDDTGLRVAGPNAQGFLNVRDRVAASFSSALEMDNLQPGDLGFVSQSGAFGFSVFSLGKQEGIDFSHVVTTGNEADLTWMDVVDHLLDDDRVRSVSAYVEGIRHGERFPELARKALAVNKPLSLLKVGRTEVGSQAAASHTAAITGAHAIFDAACRQFGVLRTHDIADIFDYARVFSPGRRAAGPRIGIVTTSGGAGVMAADEAVELGLRVEPLGSRTRQAIEALIPPFGSARNPVDVTAEVIRNPASFRTAMEAVLADDHVDMLVIVLTLVTGESALARAQDIEQIISRSDKPVVVAWSVCDELSGAALDHLRAQHIPLYPSPVRAVRALKAMADFSGAVAKFQQHRPHRTAASVALPDSLRQRLATAGALTEHEGKRLITAYGIPTPRETLVLTSDEAVAAAAEIGYPVAVKVVAQGLQHKTQAGGVRLNLADGEAVRRAAGKILGEVAEKAPDAEIKGLLVSEMIAEGTEMILGMVRDPELGTTLMLGAGGIFVETIRDVGYRLAPLHRSEAEAMIDELKSAAVLAGARGRAPGDRAALVDALCRLSDLAEDLGERISELEINPLIVLPEGQGVRALDALVVSNP